MILRGRMFGFALGALALGSGAFAGDGMARPARGAAPLEIPHTVNLDLERKARKRDRRPDNIESSQLLDAPLALKPVVWPKNSDMRARLMTPTLQRTPIVGWVAANLYRSRNDTGWCLEVDPGEGEYLVFYRLNLK